MVAKILLNSKFGWKLSRCAYKFFRWLSDNLFFLTLWTNCWDKIDFSFCNLFCSYSRKARSHPVHCKLQLKLSNRFQFQIWLALIQLQTTELRKQSQLCARFFFSQFFLVLIFFFVFHFSSVACCARFLIPIRLCISSRSHDFITIPFLSWFMAFKLSLNALWISEQLEKCQSIFFSDVLARFLHTHIRGRAQSSTYALKNEKTQSEKVKRWNCNAMKRQSAIGFHHFLFLFFPFCFHWTASTVAMTSMAPANKES